MRYIIFLFVLIIIIMCMHYVNVIHLFHVFTLQFWVYWYIWYLGLKLSIIVKRLETLYYALYKCNVLSLLFECYFQKQ